MFSMNRKQRILSPAQLKRLSEHKYSCTSVSLLDPFLQPWWCWLVSKTPLWLAPNLITIVGLIVNIVTTIILILYSPDGKSIPPRWASALCALGLFIYQSLDAIDGKQARRTNSSSPLGELFDHGCDSLSTIFVALSACISCQLGNYPNWLFFQCFTAITLFYCAHWQTYVSGTLRFGKIDVTEAQITIMGIHMISAIFGPEIWLTKIPYTDYDCIFITNSIFCSGFLRNLFTFLKMFSTGGSGKNGSTVALPYFGNYELRHVPIYIALAVDSLLSYRYSIVIMTGGCGKNGSTIAGTSVLSPVIPLALVVVPAFIIAQKSTEDIFGQHPSLYIMAFGMVAAKVTNKLVIAHMTRSEMEYMDWSMLGPLLLFLNQYFNSVLPEFWLLVFALIWGIINLMKYCQQVCLEICDHLHIKLFKIPYPPRRPSMTTTGTNAPHLSSLTGINTSSFMSGGGGSGGSGSSSSSIPSTSSHDKNGSTHQAHRKQLRNSKRQQQQQQSSH
ncbi:cholinephosphotransferase 1 isoform X5 [Condylostylus longicornis]|uniref:cholinephosphotransferase 1 isoform X5 n=1 Tax=Condylostylus longicornis TaxID=2530218 RepID=UPI00244DEC24|nr:cholinephosphotransferase 1 isoform X5 [Condylostylus longicornis]